MNTKSLLIGTVAAIALTGGANAAQINGWYLGLEAGAGWIEDWDHTQFTTNPVDTEIASASFDTGWAVFATVGYGFGRIRTEFEAGYRENDLDTYTSDGALVANATGGLREVTLMANVLYDLPLTEKLSLTVGAGAGGDFAELSLSTGPSNESDRWSFAYQGIAGVSYSIGEQASVFVNYRYLRVTETEFDFRPVSPGYFDGDDIVKHTATIGLRYAFEEAPAPEASIAPPPPPPSQQPAAAPAEFIVFFGHNKSTLVPEALRVITEAAATAKQYGAASISVVGHADRSGSDAHNNALSLRRGNVVKDALAAQGIPAGAISVSAKGENDPLVPTADGVREPQNRRVNINL